MSLILTLDLGTTYLKAGVFDANARLLYLRGVQTPIAHPHAGECEMAPEVFLQRVVQLISQLRIDCGEQWNRIAAVCFGTQTNSFLVLDRNDMPLTPIMLWPDERAKESIQPLERLMESADFRKTGVPAMSHQMTPAKLLWLQRHKPDVWKRTRRVALLSDYLTWWMTGQWITEAGVAGLTGLLDIERLQWWEPACEAAGISPEQLSQPMHAGSDLGPLRANVTEQLTLPRSCRWVIGCLDQYAGAIGVGNTIPNGYSQTTGTVLASVRCTTHWPVRVRPGIFYGPAHIPGTCWQMTFGETSASLLESYRETLRDRPLPHYGQLDADAEGVPPGCEGLRLPDEVLATHDWTRWPEVGQIPRGRVVRCILEAVALALRQQVRALCGSERPDEIRCAGGGANSRLWLQIMSDMLAVPMLASVHGEPTSAGAACLAIMGLKLNDAHGLQTAISASLRRIEPSPVRHAAYRSIFNLA